MHFQHFALFLHIIFFNSRHFNNKNIAVQYNFLYGNAFIGKFILLFFVCCIINCIVGIIAVVIIAAACVDL